MTTGTHDTSGDGLFKDGMRALLFFLDEEGFITSIQILSDTARNEKVCEAALARTGLYVPQAAGVVQASSVSVRIH